MKTIHLFSDKYPEFSPTYVVQGNIGDCWLISCILSLSLTTNGKKLLSDIFTINPDNTYSIKINDDFRNPHIITVEPIFSYFLDDKNKKQLNYIGNSVNIPDRFSKNPDTEYIWSAIIEKACSKFSGRMIKLDGNSCYAGYHLLTNKKINCIKGFALSSRFLDRLADLLERDKVACTLETHDKLKDCDLLQNHAFCIYKISENKFYLIDPHYQFININSCRILPFSDILKVVDRIIYINL